MKKLNKYFCLFDCLFWYIIKLLPILILIVLSINDTTVNLLSIMTDYFGITTNNFIVVAFVDLFGSSSDFLPVFSNIALFQYMTYYIMITIIHIVVDLIKFLPDCVHKFLERVEGGYYE